MKLYPATQIHSVIPKYLDLSTKGLHTLARSLYPVLVMQAIPCKPDTHTGTTQKTY